VWRPDDPQGNEIRKVLWEIIPYTQAAGVNPKDYKTRVLDLGCGPHKALPHFVGVDNCIDNTLFGIKFTPDVTVDTCERLPDFVDGSADAIVSSHLLEHIEDHVGALADWWRLLKPAGHLCLYLPHRDFYPNIGTEGANPDHKHDFVPADIVAAMRTAGASGWDLLECQERNGGMEYSFFMVFRKRTDGEFDEAAWSRAATQRLLTPKRLCIVRYGGFGDMIQTSYVLPELKRQGWNITVMTTPKGMDILRHDPHVDGFFLQEPDQVPNGHLGEFWEYWQAKFDGWVNLSESIEGTLLALPGRTNHQWPLAVRQKHLNRNYFEWTAELAGVDFVPGDGRFYPSEKEDEDARAFKRTLKGFAVLFVMAGSSVHKFYRWQDEVIAGLLEACPKARVITVGDEACAVLEQGWEKESRVMRLSGKLSIRETLALARQVDAVWGPETGVLNSVANEPMLKVVMLSHSSAENLTKHWRNTVAMEPVGQHCYPCHQLHYGDKHCDTDAESGTAMCQIRISPARVLDPLVNAYREWERAYLNLGRAPARPVLVTP
jgi:ADP-heptose:LPS heptosyltransferase/SAM-dependent methyltransferase